MQSNYSIQHTNNQIAVQKRSPKRDDVDRIAFLHISFSLPRQLHNRLPLFLRSARQTAFKRQQILYIRNRHPDPQKTGKERVICDWQSDGIWNRDRIRNPRSRGERDWDLI